MEFSQPLHPIVEAGKIEIIKIKAMNTRFNITILSILLLITGIATAGLLANTRMQRHTLPGQGIADHPLNTANETDKTLSPYFFIKSDNPNIDQLPLKSTSAEVNIAGVIADVIVKQEYTNTGKSAIEAIYVFPASTRAAVYAMKMTIGERTITARISERDKARLDYEAAKAEGKSASLLEQERPNVFQMNVANIMPGDHIMVELRYTELLIPENGIYEFVYPTVVGPRYSNRPAVTAPPAEHWVANPYTHEGEAPLYDFDINCRLAAGMPVNEVICPSHKTNISFDGPGDAVIRLLPEEKQGGNHDFVLRYRLNGNKVQTGMLLYPGNNENFFLAMIQPPARISPAEIPAREYVFIVDVSGSMHGFPLEVSKRLLNNLIGKLRPTDRFNVLLFAGVSNLLSESSLSANDENINRALQFIDKEQGSGGTELLPALEKALNLKKTEGYARSFIIATDGYVDVEKEAFDLIRNNLNKASFFPFGIGTSVNRYLIEGMAHAGMGQPFVVTGENEALKAAEKFNNYILSPVMTHISVDFDGIDVYDVEPLSIPDVFAERPVIVFGKYRGKPAGSILLKGENAHGPIVMKQAFTANRESASTSALQYLWARERIRTLADYSSEQPEANKDRIVELGLKYNLLTPFTSFLAIDNQIRNNGQSTTVQQPLPLPEGVSDMAVGYATGCVSAPVLKYTAHEARSEAKTITMDEADGDFSEVLPQYYGGDAALQQFISKQLKYPAAAIKAKIGGTVQLLIEIDEHGNVKVINVAKKIGYGCDEEAIRIIKLTSGKWLPGSKNGKSHKMQITIPVEFITSQAK